MRMIYPYVLLQADIDAYEDEVAIPNEAIA